MACQWGSQSSDCYRTVVASHDKCCGYNAWPRNSEHIFGSSLAFHSEFCFKCFDAVNLSRCLEIDSGRRCSDSMFCHNVESLQSCLFCFNAKGKRYAIGNVEIGKEKYVEFRAKLCAEIVRQLEATGKVAFDIYDVLGKRG